MASADKTEIIMDEDVGDDLMRLSKSVEFVKGTSENVNPIYREKILADIAVAFWCVIESNKECFIKTKSRNESEC